MPHVVLHSPLGWMTLFEADNCLVSLDWGRGMEAGCEETPLLKEAGKQLEAWFDRRLEHFDLPLAPAGTTFSARVRDALCAIPFGTTRTYGDLAQAVSSSPRAVGMACARNPLPILVPCHRVLASGGRLGGYSAFDGLQSKAWLLRFEQSAPVTS
ncbi:MULTISPECIES: methylated-DNA--[protein]-cysteine S-methyltransferase [unclassified Haematospirillum]|uniref:methylated-DNA--[protein]-cysteine S-methyltransferase n=1 Tax=unclassified Haematospirillum TaxID=2622088 RepID=UPI00143BE3CB|nr:MULTISPECIES: methylated-DNA--[protein]-cysteine S-methyltransferase [unclassified Haematospirillum]NKD55569.1 methylated-DNA--[protein]-cysteine S-methyltransferase [Haematospirillum sp. H4890]NKD75708.1 methylated-DNA--[protein]-cysteine S-methyltransferase [Haematospirillum sp. H4485]NKD88300.1 methylated-DNA--[protein]-cysteine S-methyltransferase [Haematospirillum sp. 15-248]